MKSNIGHLKAAAGAAGLFKMVKSLHEKVLAPSLGFVNPNENVDWDTIPFAVNTQLREWALPAAGIRRGAVSAFGFGGTNFHVVVEEHVPGRHRPEPTVHARGHPELIRLGRRSRPSRVSRPRSSVSAAGPQHRGRDAAVVPASPRLLPSRRAPARPRCGGALVLGGADDAAVVTSLTAALAGRRTGPGRRPHPRPADPASRPRRCAWPSTTATPPTSPASWTSSSRRSPEATRRRSGCCASRASSSGAARPPRSRSSTPARARSTSTCSKAWPSGSPLSRRSSTRRTG